MERQSALRGRIKDSVNLKLLDKNSSSSKVVKLFSFVFVPEPYQDLDWTKSSNEKLQQESLESKKPENGSVERNEHQYVLVIPQQLSNIVCVAIEYNLVVKILEYTIFPLFPPASSHLPCDLKYSTVPEIQNYIHVTSFDSISLENMPDIDESVNKGLGLSLPEYYQLELNGKHDNETSQKKKKKKSQTKYSIYGKIDSISPIISIPNDSFIVMEIYNDDGNNPVTTSNGEGDETYSCCVIWRDKVGSVNETNNILTKISIFQPGQIISLNNVQRTRWHVPTSLEKKYSKGNPTSHYYFKHRVPLYVFVVGEESSFYVHEGPILPKLLQYQKQRRKLFSPLSQLPDTISPLRAIEGIIVSYGDVQCTSGGENVGNGGTNRLSHVYKIQLTSCKNADNKEKQQDHTCQSSTQKQQKNKSPKYCWLYLTYFPMPLHISIALKIGAQIRCINVHSLPKFSNVLSFSLFSSKPTPQTFKEKEAEGFVACCRSTLTIFGLSPPKVSTQGYRESTMDTSFFSPFLRSWGDIHQTARLSNISPSSNNQLCSPVLIDYWYKCVPSLSQEIRWILSFLAGSTGSSSPKQYSAESISPMDYNEAISRLLFVIQWGNDDERKEIKKCTFNNKTKSRRDPYAEFFNHGFIQGLSRTPSLPGSACSSSCDHFLGNSSSLFNKNSDHINMVFLREIKSMGLKYIRDKIQYIYDDQGDIEGDEDDDDDSTHIHNSDTEKIFRVSASGSDIISGQQLYDLFFSSKQKIDEDNNKRANNENPCRKDSNIIHTVGEIVTSVNVRKSPMADNIEDDQTNNIFSTTKQKLFLQDSYCKCPIHLHKITGNSTNRRKENEQRNILPVNAIILSFLCVGRVDPSIDLREEAKDSIFPLHSLAQYKYKNNQEQYLDEEKEGSCGFFIIDDTYVFIASIQIIAHLQISNESQAIVCDIEDNALSSLINVRTSLEDSSYSNNLESSHSKLKGSTRVKGRFLRHNFQCKEAKRIRQDQMLYSGLTITLSHIPLQNQQHKSDGNTFATAISTVQTIEANIPIVFNVAFIQKLEQTISRTLQKTSGTVCYDNSNIIDHSQLSLVCAWWYVMEEGVSRCVSSLICASFGYDEQFFNISTHQKRSLPFHQNQEREYIDHSILRYFSLPPMAISMNITMSLSLSTKYNGYYDRLTCKHGLDGLEFTELKLSFLSPCSALSNLDSIDNSIPSPCFPLFHTIGRQKYSPGMVGRNLKRRQTGELANFPLDEESSGVPTVTIQEIYLKLLSQSVKSLIPKDANNLDKVRKNGMSPSIVRRINQARFLGVQFCRARVFCLKCSKFYCMTKTRKNVRAKTTVRGKNSSSCDPICKKRKRNSEESHRVNNEKEFQSNCDKSKANKRNNSFWHLPLPASASTSYCEKSIDPSTSLQGFLAPHILIPPPTLPLLIKEELDEREGDDYVQQLRCPSYECSSYDREHAVVKWECSGMLDDGTGQLKLYAENAAALSLLGLSKDQVKLIEKAAWTRENGILFDKTLVISNHMLKAKLESSWTQAQEKRQASGENTKKKQSTYDFLPIEDRAEYDMYVHCKESKIPERRLEYLCRVKSFSSISKFNGTESEERLIDTINLLDCTEVNVLGESITSFEERKKNIGDKSAEKAGSVESAESFVYYSTKNLAVRSTTLQVVKVDLVDCSSSRSSRDIGWNLIQSLQ